MPPCSSWLSRVLGASRRWRGAGRSTPACTPPRARNFDVALLDLSLPDSCGLDTFRTLAIQAPLLPVVVLSGNDDEGTAIEAVRLGAQDYLPKGSVLTDNSSGLELLVQRRLLRGREVTQGTGTEASPEDGGARAPGWRDCPRLQQSAFGDFGLLPADAGRDRQTRSTSSISSRWCGLPSMPVTSPASCCPSVAARAAIRSRSTWAPHCRSWAPCSSAFSGEDIGLSLDVTCHDTQILGDAGSFEQIIMNLVVNAREAMPDGGELRIKAREKRPRHRSGRSNPAESVHIEVTDTGVGMAPELLEKVFMPFFTTKAETGGTGLGLATVQSIVSQLGGHLGVRSVLGVGTTLFDPPPLYREPADEHDKNRGAGRTLRPW